MSTELVAIFDQCIGLEEQAPMPTENSIVVYDDGDAYLNRQRGRKKPLPPSQQAIVEYYNGDKSPKKIVQTFVARSVLIGTALAIFGENKNQKALVQNALVASASIEGFLLYWYKIKHK